VWRAATDLPTRHGLFKMHVFTEAPAEGDPEGVVKEHVAMVFGDVAGTKALPVRVHSECLTSEVFGSLKCDCREQLETALTEVARRGAGAVLYLRQEGRGIGLINKVRAYALQSEGHDTVDANRLLGLPDDTRDYASARAMLEHLGVESIQLMTNNPEKVNGLRALGVRVEGRLPVLIPANPFSRGYLETKRARMAHILPTQGEAAPKSAPAWNLALAANGDAE
jgi:GTP cyclohydrolase II